MDEPSESQQTVHDAWVAFFEILGLQSWASLDAPPLEAGLTQNGHVRLAEFFNQSIRAPEQPNISSFWLPNCFVIHTNNSQGKSYSLIQRSAKAFFEKCLTAGVPLRGAISVGPIVSHTGSHMLTGKALVDAMVVGSDQDWLGLLLTQGAATRIRALGLKPEEHGFATSANIPMRNYLFPVLAYQFQNGIANFDSSLIPALEKYQAQADANLREQYQRTLDFIRNCYSRLGTPDHA